MFFRRLFAWLTALWAAVVLGLTLTPAAELPRLPEWKLLSFDTAAHAGVFAVLAGLSWAWRRRGAGGLLLACVGFGALIEVLQYLMGVGRHAEWSDLLSDAIGAGLVLGPLALWPRRARANARGAAALGLLLTLGLSPGTAHGQAGPNMARARRTIEVLASPKMRGRGYVDGGERRAADYLRGRLRALGLAPLAPDYTQRFTLDVNTFPGRLKLRLTRPTGAAAPDVVLRPGQDFLAAAYCPPARLTGCFTPLDTAVFRDTALARRYLLPRPDVREKRCGHTLLLRARDRVRLAQLPPATQQRLAEYQHITLVPKLTATLAAEQAPAARFEVLASRWPTDTAVTYHYLAGQVDAQLLPHYPTQNLAAVVRGAVQPDSFLVVSAHYDHLGMMGRKVYFPGANDNASGVALLLELAAYYARPENRPACSVAFLLFGAEEAGLVGSRYFVQHPLLPLARIKFLVNLDLLGTGEAGATVVNGRVLPAAFAQLSQLNAAGRYLPSLAPRGPAANSDHFPFSEAGVPAFFLYTRGGSKAYHDVQDTPDQLSLAGFAGAFGLVRDFLNQRGARPAGR